MEDNNNNWNSTTGLSIEVVDTTSPTYSDLVESADPLKLGNTEIITINVTDPSGINQVLIEIGGVNYTMEHIPGTDMWRNYSWTPTSVGIKPYVIYMEDNNNNWNSTTGLSIEVVDTTSPTYSDLSESADPLELGNTEIITINVTDPSGINQVLIEIEGVNYTMEHIPGTDMWRNYSWTPTSVGIKPYVIYMEDNNNNWNSTTGLSIEVVDTTSPTYSDLSESADPLELGNTEIITINVTDPSGINQVLIEIGGVNYTMEHIPGTDMWRNYSWTPTSVGPKPYVIYMEDNNNNWNTTSGSIQVNFEINPPTYSNLIESTDPLELGNTEIITINVTDPSGINQVLIEISGVNYTMEHIPGTDMWRNYSWIPTSVGIKLYVIYMEDNNNNWNTTSGSIQVIDSSTPTPPSDGGGGGGGGGSGGSSSGGDSDILPMILVIVGIAAGALIGIIIFMKKGKNKTGKTSDKEIEIIEKLIGNR